MSTRPGSRVPLAPLSFEPADLWKTWTARKPGEKNLHVVVGGIILCTVYFALVFPLSAKQIDRIGYDMQKQKAREKTMSKAPEGKTPPPDLFGGKSLPEAQKDLADLQERLEAARGAVQQLERAFVSMDDTLAMNALKTGLTSLAESGDMEVLAVEHIYLKAEDKAKPPSAQLLREAAAANPYKRPLLKMRARASYRGLMQFLNGLSALPYIAAPVWSDVSVGLERHPETKLPVRQWLEVEIRFAV
ncbi:MAG: hypothetical protein QM739_07750 [Propionivibrio sp.]